MKKCLIALLVSIVATTTILAKEIPQSPGKYVPGYCAVVKNPNSPYNTDGESITAFFSRFTSDKKFRKSRINLDSEYYDGNVTEYIGNQADYLDNMKVGAGRANGEKWYGTFDIISPDEVWYFFESLPDGDAEWGGGSITAGFERKDGKWYLIFIQIAG